MGTSKKAAPDPVRRKRPAAKKNEAVTGELRQLPDSEKQSLEAVIAEQQDQLEKMMQDPQYAGIKLESMVPHAIDSIVHLYHIGKIDTDLNYQDLMVHLTKSFKRK